MEQLTIFSAAEQAAPTSSTADDLVRNQHIELAIENGWWNDIEALSDFRDTLEVSCLDMLAIGAATHSAKDELRECRQAIRTLSEQIKALNH